jgi:hypothetical protein
MVYEDEIDNCSENWKVVISEKLSDGREKNWNGKGLMRKFEG